jgi:hypothetical protein
MCLPARGLENIVLLERERVIGERTRRGNADLIFGGNIGGRDHWYVRHCENCDLAFGRDSTRLATGSPFIQVLNACRIEGPNFEGKKIEVCKIPFGDNFESIR